MLTVAQIEARKGKITASRIACLMRGDRAAILRLYHEMIGDAAEEDLTAIWPVQLGSATEKLNLDWFERKNGLITRRGEVVTHPKHAWAAATLDGWCEALHCPIETKHVGGREPQEVVIERYQPQCQWQMECTGAKECALSTIRGADEPLVDFIPFDDDYAAEMVRRGHQFIQHVERRIPPVELPPVPAPADASKIYNMTNNNLWANYGAVWLTSKPAFDQCRDAERLLKEIVPADAKKCSGHGVRITRDRAGRLSLRRDE